MGKAYVRFRYSMIAGMVTGNAVGVNPEDISMALQSLPPQTKVIGVQEEDRYMNTDLTRGFTLVVENPLFTVEDYIEFEYRRMAAVVPEGQTSRFPNGQTVQQFNTFGGVNIHSLHNVFGSVCSECPDHYRNPPTVTSVRV